MKKFLAFSILAVAFLLVNKSKAQTLTTTDTVCVNTTGVIYKVTGTTGSTYNWIITGGTVASGQTTDSITVNWNSTAGAGSVFVVETNTFGCLGDTIKLNVVKLAVPTATISGVDTVCQGFAPVGNPVSITLTGTGPWNVVYTDGTNNFNVNGITSSPYVFNPGVISATTTYSLVSVVGKKSCTGTVSGSATITLAPKPTTSAIFHN